MSAQGLPAHILALFTPRPPPQHLPAPARKKPALRDGVAEYVEYFSADVPPAVDDFEDPKQRKERRHKEKMKAHQDHLKQLIAKYKPHEDANAAGDAAGDPFRTLFVGRLSYDTTEKKLKREFEVFGSVKKVRMVYDLKGKPRGYAFIHFDHERDLKNAYKQGDGKKIDGRRVMVDVERGRTVEGWLPRRLGGGRGPGRVGKPSKKKQRLQEAREKAERAREREAKEKERGARDDRGGRGNEAQGDRRNDRRDRDTRRERGGDDRKNREDKGKDRENDRDRKDKDRDRKDRDRKDRDEEKPGEKARDEAKPGEKAKRDRSRSRGDRDRKRRRE